jgi:hypothetical protein
MSDQDVKVIRPTELAQEKFASHVQSINRGLVIWNETPWEKRKPGDRTVFLTKAGELTCLLLVEAGLMPVGKKVRR